MRTMEEMPEQARVWIYQSDSFLSETLEHDVLGRLQTFIAQWTSHGASMDACAAIFHHRLIVIAADEQQAAASGCGIDKSVHFMQSLGRELGIDFFQRTTVIFGHDQDWREAPIHQFWAMRKAGQVNDQTRILDTTVRTLGELRSALVKPFGDSWHKDMWGR